MKNCPRFLHKVMSSDTFGNFYWVEIDSEATLLILFSRVFARVELGVKLMARK